MLSQQLHQYWPSQFYQLVTRMRHFKLCSEMWAKTQGNSPISTVLINSIIIEYLFRVKSSQNSFIIPSMSRSLAQTAQPQLLNTTRTHANCARCSALFNIHSSQGRPQPDYHMDDHYEVPGSEVYCLKVASSRLGWRLACEVCGRDVGRIEGSRLLLDRDVVIITSIQYKSPQVWRDGVDTEDSFRVDLEKKPLELNKLVARFLSLWLAEGIRRIDSIDLTKLEKIDGMLRGFLKFYARWTKKTQSFVISPKTTQQRPW